jgi:hypothetical protein
MTLRNELFGQPLFKLDPSAHRIYALENAYERDFLTRTVNIGAFSSA